MRLSKHCSRFCPEPAEGFRSFRSLGRPEDFPQKLEIVNLSNLRQQRQA
jgi:hypothetical protein